MPTALKLKTKAEIVAQQRATLAAQLDPEMPEIDVNVGAILRAIIEASSLSDAEQHVMIGKVLDLFDRYKTKGVDLDRRALDYGSDVFEEMRRRRATSSITNLVVSDGNALRIARLEEDVQATSTSFEIDDETNWPSSGAALLERGTPREETIVFVRAGTTISVVSPVSGLVNPHIARGSVETVAIKSVLASTISAGASSCDLEAGTEDAWPSAGTVIFERETIRREAIEFTRAGTTLTLDTVTTYDHVAFSDLVLSTFGSDRNIDAGSVAYTAETETARRVLFRTTEASVLLDGDLVSESIPAESDDVGSQTRVGANTIRFWQSEPFANARVTNPNAAARGSDQESDDAYNARISAFIQSLSRATALAIETMVTGKRDPFSNLLVAFAQTVEPVAPGESILYITDGTTTFAIDTVVLDGRDVLISDARPNDQRARLNNFGPFAMVANPPNNRTPRIFRSIDQGEASDVGANYLEDSTKNWGADDLAGWHVKTDDNQFYEIASNTSIGLTLNADGATPSLGAYSIFDFTQDPLEPGVDYAFNRSNGDLELVTPLVEHDGLVAVSDNALPSVGAYTYARGLAAFVQRLVNGDKKLLDEFPGIKALGTHVRVVAPTIISPSITIQIVTESGFADADLARTVKTVIQTYINGLGIGERVLLSEIIRLVKTIVGVKDCKVISPSSNVTVSDGQIPRVNDTHITVV